METSDALIASALVRIKSIENASVPEDNKINHTFSKDFEKKIDKILTVFDEKGRYTEIRSLPLKRIAAVIAVVLAGYFSLVMINPQARADFKNTIIELYETHIKFYFETTPASSIDFKSIDNIYASHIPEGFTLKDTSSEYEAIAYKYENEKEGRSYEVYVSLNDGLSVITDENKDLIEEMTIGGRLCYLLCGESEGKPYSTLIITGNKIAVTVYGELTRDEVIKVGEGIKEN